MEARLEFLRQAEAYCRPEFYWRPTDDFNAFFIDGR